MIGCPHRVLPTAASSFLIGTSFTFRSEAGRVVLPMRTGVTRTAVSARSSSRLPLISATALTRPSAIKPKVPNASTLASGTAVPTMCPRTTPPRWTLTEPSRVPLPFLSVMLGASSSKPSSTGVLIGPAKIEIDRARIVALVE